MGPTSLIDTVLAAALGAVQDPEPDQLVPNRADYRRAGLTGPTSPRRRADHQPALPRHPLAAPLDEWGTPARPGPRTRPPAPAAPRLFGADAAPGTQE